MKLTLKNIGKIDKATIEFYGLTVIGGENNTGKSTVGKVLFAICNSFFALDKKIEFERRTNVENLISRLYLGNGMRPFARLDENAIAGKILKTLGNRVNESTDIDVQEEIIDIIKEYDESRAKGIDEKILKDVSSNIKTVLQVTDYEIFTTILEKKLVAEFNEQISNIFNEKTGEIQLEYKNQDFRTIVKDSFITEISHNVFLPFNADVIYIDDPFILENYRLSLPPFFYGYFDHQGYLRSKLNQFSDRGNVIDDIIVNEKLKDVFDKLSVVCGGDIVIDKPQVGYRRKGSKKALNIHNLSTGFKTFVILKILLLNGSLGQNGVLILDEPEIHLHPEWQLLFAEIIVLLQKEFDLYVLLNTHSPYFLRALEVYAAKHNVTDKCKYYLAENVKDKAVIADVTDDLEKIYAKLAHPLQKLEDERWKDAESE